MNFRKYKKMLFLLLAAVGMMGCVQEYGGGEIPTPPSSNEVTITVTVPGQQIPTTRSIAGANGEATVAFIDLLVFGTDGKFSRHVPGTDLAPVADDPNYKVTFKAALSVEQNDEMVVILANVPASTIADLEEGDTKLEVLSKLTDSSDEDEPWDADPAGGYTPIPMYGEVSIGSISTPVTLTRMLARVDVVNNATTDFTLTDVYVVNRNTKGYIAQAWNESTGDLLSPQYVGDPMVPEDANPLEAGVVSTIGNALHYDYGTGLSGEIYLYEAKANPNEVMEENIDHTKSICLIVKGKWLEDGKDYYYRIDFTGGNKDLAPDKVPYMPVYRNHLYTFDITAVNGPGYGSFDAALQSLGVLNNLKTHLHTVDMSGIRYMVFNGQHYIGVNQEELNIEGWSNTSHKLTIFTNAKDLKATKTDGWITITDQPTNDSGEKYMLTFDVSRNGFYDYSPRKGTIKLTAGRLTYNITINQDRNIPLAPPGVIGYIHNPGQPDHHKLTLRGSKEYAGTLVEEYSEVGDLYPATVYVAYFKWGSLIATGSEGGINDVFDKDDIICVPEELINGGGTPAGALDYMKTSVIGDNTADVAWVLVPYNPNTTWPNSPADNAAGHGNPCTYYFGGEGWRMPITDNNNSWHGPDGPFGVSTDDGIPWTTRPGRTAIFADNTKGAYADLPNTGAVAGDGNYGQNWGMFLPYAGSRAPADGMMNSADIRGRYWASNLNLKGNYGHLMRIERINSYPYWSDDVRMATAVRCVRP